MAQETAMKHWAEEVQVQETALQTQIVTLSAELVAAKVLQNRACNVQHTRIVDDDEGGSLSLQWCLVQVEGAINVPVCI